MHCAVKDSDTFEIGLREDDVVYHLAGIKFVGALPKLSHEEWFSEVNVLRTELQ